MEQGTISCGNNHNSFCDLFHNALYPIPQFQVIVTNSTISNNCDQFHCCTCDQFHNLHCDLFLNSLQALFRSALPAPSLYLDVIFLDKQAADPLPSLSLYITFWLNTTLSRKVISFGGHPERTSAENWDFLTPSPLVRGMMSLLLHKCLYFVHFGLTPPSPRPRTSFMDTPNTGNQMTMNQTSQHKCF